MSPQLDAVPSSIGPLEARPITFSGLSVGGWAQLTLYSNGAYNFGGHFHNSGGAPFEVACAFAVRDGKGTAYTFKVSGTAHGLDPGSRDFDWNSPNRSTTDAALAAGWTDFFRGRGLAWSWHAGAALDVPEIVRSVVEALGPVSAVIAIL